MPELMQTIFRLPEDSLSVRILKRLEKWSIRFADLVLTVNLACKKIYSSRSCEPGKIKVVINSPDDVVFPLQQVDVRHVNGKNRNGSDSVFSVHMANINLLQWENDVIRRIDYDFDFARLTTARRVDLFAR